MHQLAATPLHPHPSETFRLGFPPLTEIIRADKDFEASEASEQKPGCQEWYN